MYVLKYDRSAPAGHYLKDLKFLFESELSNVEIAYTMVYSKVRSVSFGLAHHWDPKYHNIILKEGPNLYSHIYLGHVATLYIRSENTDSSFGGLWGPIAL